jgi:branched-chain amino acid transport system ATP-binding protein
MLEVNKIDVFYKSLHVLKEISLHLSENETIGIIGPNGHGKTTLLKTISGLLKPKNGYIKFNDTLISNLAPEKIVNLGVIHVPQGAQLWDEMTVEETLLLGAFTDSAWKKREENFEMIYQLFPKLLEYKNKKCWALSGGERQMVALGRGLMSSTKLLMLDEPTMGLAPNLARELVSKISEIKESGIPIILVEQNVIYAADLSDRMYLIENGEVVLDLLTDEIMTNEHVRKAYLGV